MEESDALEIKSELVELDDPEKNRLEVIMQKCIIYG